MRFQKNILASLVGLLCLLLAGSAFACYTVPTSTFGADGSSLTAFMGNAKYTTYSGSLSGAYDVSGLFSETSNTINFKNSAGSVLLNNWDSCDWGKKPVSNLAGTSFDVSSWCFLPTTNIGIANAAQVHILALGQDVIYKGQTLCTGTLIIGLEDTNSCLGGYDYNDFILAASKCAPTPVPAAVLLLGSGLMSALGFKRIRKSKVSA